jgi:hypothetical protein
MIKFFIEVSTKEGPEINYKDTFGGVEVGEFKLTVDERGYTAYCSHILTYQ